VPRSRGIQVLAPDLTLDIDAPALCGQGVFSGRTRRVNGRQYAI